MVGSDQNNSAGTCGIPAKPFDVIHFALRRVLPSILLGTLLFLPLAWLAVKFSSSYYEAEGLIRLTRAIAPLLAGGDQPSIDGYYHTYVNTQVHFLTKEETLKKTLDALPADVRAAFSVKFLEKRLQAHPVMGTHLIEVALEAGQREGVAEVINGVMQTYIDSARQESEDSNQKRLAYLRTESAKLKREQAEAQDELNRITTQLQTGVFEETYNPYRAKLKLLQEAHIKAKTDVELKEAILGQTRPPRADGRRLPLEVEKARRKAQAELDAARRSEQNLRAEIAAIEELAARRSAELLHGQETKDRLTKITENVERLEQRIFDLTLESKQPTRASIESWAVPPEKPSGSNLPKLLVVCLVLAYGSVAGLFLLYDATDNRIRGTRDLKNALGAEPFRPIPHCRMSGGRGRFPLSRVTLDYPRSNVAIALRGLALRLNQERERHGAKVAMFTAVEEGAGTTAILLNTACVMTRFCEKILVIEANTDRPDLSNRVNTTHVPGTLQHAISGGKPLAECVARDEDRGVDVLLAGEEQTAALPSQHFEALIDSARAQYDFVLIDSAPILESDVTECVAHRADASVLVVEGDYSFYRDVRRVMQFIFRLEVPVLIGVLNWGGHPRRPWFCRLGKLRMTDA